MNAQAKYSFIKLEIMDNLREVVGAPMGTNLAPKLGGLPFIKCKVANMA
jgi:hypothetical protein